MPLCVPSVGDAQPLCGSLWPQGLCHRWGSPAATNTALAETDTRVPGEQGWVGLNEALQTAWSIFRMSDSAGKCTSLCMSWFGLLFFSFTLSHYLFHLLSHDLAVSEGSGRDWQFRATWETLN